MWVIEIEPAAEYAASTVAGEADHLLNNSTGNENSKVMRLWWKRCKAATFCLPGEWDKIRFRKLCPHNRALVPPGAVVL